MNRGELRHPIEIWENKITETTNRVGEEKEAPELVATVFAKLEFRGGGLLTGRAADSVLSKTTQKFTYAYNAYPDLLADKNWIEYRGKKYDILYILNEGERDEYLQVFTEERAE
jgi:hypothetical protein|nr:MAG TPA: Putative head tail adaptor [Caudoviricetes sp.]